MSESLLSLRAVSFTYPAVGDAPASGPVLKGCSLELPAGAFGLLCGATGSGKSTLLRLAVPALAPAGTLDGSVQVAGVEAQSLGAADAAQLVGYVGQDPSAQVVCDSVWHEVAFGLENLGVEQGLIRRRVAEAMSFLGLSHLYDRRVDELSGGERQLVVLASVLALRPRLLLLDEPTSMLDVVAEHAYAHALFRMNRELGIGVLLSTHRPGALGEYATCAWELRDGAVQPRALADVTGSCAYEIADDARGAYAPDGAQGLVADASAPPALWARDVWFRHSAQAPWALRRCSLRVAQGSVHALVGGNGAGKSTLLALAAGLRVPEHGRVELAPGVRGSCALLPQDPLALFACDTVDEELMEWSQASDYTRPTALTCAYDVGLLVSADGSADADVALLARNPLDLSGGQCQLLALAKLLVLRPRLLLLDEPTKGLDVAAATSVAATIRRVRSYAASIVIATHDLALVRAVADEVTLLFCGEDAATLPPEDFFADTLLWSGR